MEKHLKELLAFLWKYNIKRHIKNKIKLYGNFQEMYSWMEYSKTDEHVKIFSKLGKVHLDWYKYFTLVRQIEDPKYVPEDIWHVEIEPRLNNKSYAKAFNDKNLFELHIPAEYLPKTIIHCIAGVLYDVKYKTISKSEAFEILSKHTQFVVKKSIDSGGGKGIKLYNGFNNIEQIFQNHGKDFIVQEKAEQSEWFARFNVSSINTIRIMTYRSVIDEKVHVIQALFRMGKQESFVDNQSSGGIACGVDLISGKLNEWGSDKLSVKFFENNGVKFKDCGVIPNFEKLKSECIEIAKKRFHERFLVFDTWQDVEGNVKLMEINNVNIGIEDLQKNNGPLLGNFTQEIVDFCAKSSTNFSFDFEL